MSDSGKSSNQPIARRDFILVDPQSYNNLEVYDRGLMSGMEEKVTFFGNRRWGGDIPRGVEARFPFRYSDCRNVISKAWSYFRSIRFIRRYAEAARPVVVHIQWLRAWSADWALLRQLKRLGIRVVYTAHNILPHDSGLSWHKNMSRYYAAVDAIIVHSEQTKKEMLAMFTGLSEKKIHVIPHGVLDFQINEEAVLQRVQELREAHELNGKTVIASLGVQSPYKGVDEIIRAWATTPELRDNPDIRLLLAGRNSGLDYSPLEGIKNVIIAEGRLDDVDFMAYARLASVAFLPYREISQSGVLFTAISNGIPVAVSNVGGLPEPLRHGKVGWNIGIPSFENIRDSLLWLSANPEEIRKTADDKGEFQKVRQYYSWESISRQTLALYENLRKL